MLLSLLRHIAEGGAKGVPGILSEKRSDSVLLPCRCSGSLWAYSGGGDCQLKELVLE